MHEALMDTSKRKIWVKLTIWAMKSTPKSKERLAGHLPGPFLLLIAQGIV
jgi:hypothetical protein